MSYADETFITDDLVVDLLLEYGRQLADEDSSDLVSFPILLPDGTVGTAQILIGPASEVVAIDTYEIAELPVDEAVQYLRDNIRRTAPPSVMDPTRYGAAAEPDVPVAPDAFF